VLIIERKDIAEPVEDPPLLEPHDRHPLFVGPYDRCADRGEVVAVALRSVHAQQAMSIRKMKMNLTKAALLQRRVDGREALSKAITRPASVRIGATHG